MRVTGTLGNQKVTADAYALREQGGQIVRTVVRQQVGGVSRLMGKLFRETIQERHLSVCFAHQGESSAHQGEAFAYVGESFTHQGEPFTYLGESFAYQGDLLAHQGELPAYQGEFPTHQGELFAEQGGLLPYQGEPSAHQGEPAARQDGFFDQMGGSLRGTGERPVRRGPPLRFGGGLSYDSPAWKIDAGPPLGARRSVRSGSRRDTPVRRYPPDRIPHVVRHQQVAALADRDSHGPAHGVAVGRHFGPTRSHWGTVNVGRLTTSRIAGPVMTQIASAPVTRFRQAMSGCPSPS